MSNESASRTLLDDVIENYLGTLSEIEFFDAFNAILRSNGFYDIARTHGPGEFGRDFVAKRVDDGQVVQYAIQTKAGDLNQGDWRNVRNQIEDIRLTRISNPAFDPDLPRIAVLATTGRLVGNAPTSSHDYKLQYEKEGEFNFEVWQLERLIEMMVDAPEAGLAGDAGSSILGAVAAIHLKTFTEPGLNELSLDWVNRGPASLWMLALEALIISSRLEKSGRVDLASMTGAHLVRSVWAVAHGDVPVSATALAVADVGKGILTHHASSLLASVDDIENDSRAFLSKNHDAGVVITYPVRCSRLLEILGLAGLAHEDEETRRKYAVACIHLIQNQPGTSHPISDNWAVSIVPAAILIWEIDRRIVSNWLRAICVWIADSYDRGRMGLADTSATPAEEVRQLLGADLPFSKVNRRSESFIATVLLDLAAALEMPDLYNEVINEIMAVRIFPQVVESEDGSGQYVDATEGVYIELWMRYDDAWNEDTGWQHAPHHRRAKSLYLSRIGRSWDLLAICSVLRDRCLPLLIRFIAGLDVDSVDSRETHP